MTYDERVRAIITAKVGPTTQAMFERIREAMHLYGWQVAHAEGRGYAAGDEIPDA